MRETEQITYLSFTGKSASINRFEEDNLCQQTAAILIPLRLSYVMSFPTIQSLLCESMIRSLSDVITKIDLHLWKKQYGHKTQF